MFICVLGGKLRNVFKEQKDVHEKNQQLVGIVPLTGAR